MSKIDTTILPDLTTDQQQPQQPEDGTRQTATKSPDRLILAITALVLILWGLSIAAFGIPGLYIPALVAVPVIFTVLMVITRG